MLINKMLIKKFQVYCKFANIFKANNTLNNTESFFTLRAAKWHKTEILK